MYQKAKGCLNEKFQFKSIKIQLLVYIGVAITPLIFISIYNYDILNPLQPKQTFHS